MIDGVINVVHPSARAGAKLEGEQTLETIAVAGASAIQRLISERDNLRACVNSQHGDLVNLTAANVEFRRCIISIRHHYIELATKVLAQLEQFDHATRDLMQERHGEPFDGGDEDANLVSLAHRLKPTGAKAASVGKLDE
jgi:hypothetical protein